jgi:hypothetical protein
LGALLPLAEEEYLQSTGASPAVSSQATRCAWHDGGLELAAAGYLDLQAAEVLLESANAGQEAAALRAKLIFAELQLPEAALKSAQAILKRADGSLSFVDAVLKRRDGTV